MEHRRFTIYLIEPVVLVRKADKECSGLAVAGDEHILLRRFGFGHPDFVCHFGQNLARMRRPCK